MKDTYFPFQEYLGQTPLDPRNLDQGFLERAIEKFQQAQDQLDNTGNYSPRAWQLFWEYGAVWVALGKKSGEPADFLKGIEKFQEAARRGCDLPRFRLDYGEALVHVGELTGDPKLLTSAVSLFKEVVISCYAPEGALLEPAAHQRGWRLLVLASKRIAEMTGSEEDFSEADRLCHEAILALPSEASLWLEWGELHLTQAWIQKSASYVESAFEKLTSSKIPECDPFKASLLLGEGLLLLGLFLEDFKFLKDGETKILELMKEAPEDPEVLSRVALSSLMLGIYFSDEKYFLRALEEFQKALSYHRRSFKAWSGLFQTYLSWADIQESPIFFEKAIQVSARLIEMYPFSPYLLSQRGLAFFKFYRLEKNDSYLLEESIAHFQKAIELQNGQNEPEWLFFQACAWDALGDHFKGEESAYERAIFLLYQTLEKAPHSVNVRFHLALTLSHYGEVSGDVESLYRAHSLFEAVVQPDEENSEAWCEWGYLLLLLFQAVWNEHVPSEEGLRLRGLAETRLIRAAELGNGVACYYLACLYSLSSLLEASMASLERAERIGFLPSIEELEEDEWLEEVRKTPSFQKFLIDSRRDGHERLI